MLLERGTELFAFVHLTFQEYFAAWEICRRCGKDADRAWEEISPCLHQGHWREVILLLIAKLDEMYPDEMGQELIQKILEAESPYEDLLKRNLLMAGACLADDVTAETETYQLILDEIISAAMRSPYSLQKSSAADVLKDLLVPLREPLDSVRRDERRCILGANESDAPAEESSVKNLTIDPLRLFSRNLKRVDRP